MKIKGQKLIQNWNHNQNQKQKQNCNVSQLVLAVTLLTSRVVSVSWRSRKASVSSSTVIEPSESLSISFIRVSDIWAQE